MTRIGDLFAGGGGVTLGAELVGMQVVFAANHWPEAVALHRRHFPHVQIAQQDLRQFNFACMPRVDILWASPSCQGNSEAAQPSRVNASVVAAHDDLRSTAWAVTAAVLAQRPPKFVAENVPEFREWTVLPTNVGMFAEKQAAKDYAATRAVDGATYKVLRERVGDPGAKRWIYVVVRLAPKGVLFDQWIDIFRSAGYAVTVQVLTASRWGTDQHAPAPQRRRRLIIVGHLGAPIELADDRSVVERSLGDQLELDAGPWRPISKIKRDAARARAEHANELFGGTACWGQHVSHRGAWGRPLSQPCTTLTTQNQHWLVRRGEYRLFTVAESAAVQTFPRNYFDGVARTAALVMAGNAVPPSMAARILQEVERA